MVDYFYKNLARSAGLLEISQGQDIEVDINLVLAHDGTGPKLLKLWNPEERVFDGRRVVFTVDHAFPAPTPQDRAFHKEFAVFSKVQGCTLYNKGEGVLHQVVAERLSLCPGMIIAGADGHVATAGAFGAIAFALTPEELIPVMTTGKLRLKVPHVLSVQLDGELGPGILPRDVALYLSWKLGDQINGKAIALSGALVNGLSDAGCMAICNFLPEAGAVTAFIVPPGEEGRPNFTLYAREIEAMIAVPPSPAEVRFVHELEGTTVTVAIAGGCSSGRVEDMEVIAEVLRDQSVHPEVTFIITPASREVAKEMDNKGLSTLLRDRGALIMSPGCGPCPGKHFGVLAEGDVAITTTVKNTPGRIGSTKASIYLASPRTVAQAAVKGVI
ncbi:3-isopropylmalate/(R)-2-methylmalate dehydratase large subunit [Desulfosporosinus lacus DSM 15449]|uniref:3-isopropylmalate/(R)-2-methylmalate dehydratase large subunit n=1 Tax=Desulfosporosinus lacus DSM 15449 TaxID=1121420 RepID=A0A1M6C6J5_9FIRM|nr:3-isopropylmalate/(R)-2-methylmalate dehydratase large subunit [Desulfosporosinus lacus DSM 15449]